MPPLRTSLGGSQYHLNSAGVAGLIGGEEAIPAMATISLFRGGRWLGWYNSPGSYIIAKRFGRIANSRLWTTLFPGSRVSPALASGLDGTHGPKYIGALSGTTMDTGHLGYLTMERCKQIRPVNIPGRITTHSYVTYLDLATGSADTVERLPFKGALFALIPIAISVFACTICVLVSDWFSFSMIFLGIISSGLASCIIGGGKLIIKRPSSRVAPGAPPGHGILIGKNNVVVIKGSEREVNAITKGHFDLEINLRSQANEDDADEVGGIAENSHAVGFCSLLFLFQFLSQLLLVPLGSLFGQIMFFTSLVVSWAYNSYLASLKKKNIQARMLFQTLGNPSIFRFRVGTRTTMSVFVCLLLSHRVESEQKRSLFQRTLHSLIPNDSVVWRRWREKVVNQLVHLDDEPKSLPFFEEDDEDQELSESDRRLLRTLLADVASAFKGYFDICGQLPSDSS